ncbi:hypothetical protein BKI52_04315 [marine bacterium AO1-C]|nr:hypothetical protein BKI52_04315 [marine bacterium AO1-C]
MIIFTNKFLDIELNKEKSLFIWSWKADTNYMTPEELFEYCQIIADNIMLYECQYLISDGTNMQFIITPEYQEKIFKIIAPVVSFVKKFAHILPSEFVANIAARQIWEEDHKGTYVEKYFSSLEEAKEWLFQ